MYTTLGLLILADEYQPTSATQKVFAENCRWRWATSRPTGGLLDEGLVSCQVFLMPSPSLAPDHPRDLLLLSSSSQRLDVFDAFEYKNKVFRHVPELLEE